MLFGIKGAGWNSDTLIKNLYNKNWVSPLPEECPKDLNNFLNGEKIKAYW